MAFFVRSFVVPNVAGFMDFRIMKQSMQFHTILSRKLTHCQLPLLCKNRKISHSTIASWYSPSVVGEIRRIIAFEIGNPVSLSKSDTLQK